MPHHLVQNCRTGTGAHLWFSAEAAPDRPHVGDDGARNAPGGGHVCGFPQRLELEEAYFHRLARFPVQRCPESTDMPQIWCAVQRAAPQ